VLVLDLIWNNYFSWLQSSLGKWGRVFGYKHSCWTRIKVFNHPCETFFSLVYKCYLW